MEANPHRVPPKQWKKWSEHARRVFNHLYRLMGANQKFFRHTLADEVPAKHWETTAWNVAWEAADAVDNRALRAGDIVQDVHRGKLVTEHVVQ